MTDVSKIKGGITQPEPKKAEKKEGKEAEEIKEKWSKVGKVDPDQRKQKKAKAQEEAESQEKLTSAPHQGLQAEPKGPSLYEPTGGKGPEIGEGVGEGPLPPSAPPPYFPQAEEPEFEGPGAPAPTEKKEEAKQAPQKKPAIKKEKAEKKKAVAKKEPAPKLEKGKKAEAPPTPPLEKAAETLAKEPAQMPKAEEKIEKPEKKEEALQAAPPPPEPLPKGAWEATKEAEKKEKVEKGQAKPPPTTTLPTGLTAKAPPAAAAAAAPTPPPLAAPFAHLSAPVQQLFERMVGVMTVLHETGISQTTLSLDNPQFEHSVFYGAQIVITEFSTAPKTFNIELLGNQQAVDLMSANAEELVAAFQAGNYNFKVNRVDTSYLPPVGEAKRRKVGRVKRKKLK
ncbi:MAG: hypothetical protein KR126chlam3_00564 [Chlamydiae bacterium]|nr:hypothetical protein [Chlamydiota bacterium]